MSEILGASERASLEAESGAERPLTPDERALLQRLLSDPFSYPIQFKTWLVSFLEGSDLLLPRSSVQGLTSLLGSGGGQGVLGLLPAGIIFPYGGAAAPVGALLCNGAAYSRTGYKRLFDTVGTAYGAGDGSTTFNVPDLRRRLPVGAGSGEYGLGADDGQGENNRSLKHTHYFTESGGVAGSTSPVGDHNHGLNVVQASGKNINIGQQAVQLYAEPLLSYLGTDGAGGHDHWFEAGFTVAGWTSGGFLADTPAYLAVGYIVNY